jgi:hypothetical protein
LKVVFLSLESPKLSEKFANLFGLREPGDIQLLGPFLRTDKDRIGGVAAHRTFSDAVSAVDQGPDIARPAPLGDGV